MNDKERAIKACIDALGYLNHPKPTDNQLWLAIDSLKQAQKYADNAYFIARGKRFEEEEGA